MLEIFQYSFMIRALLAGTIISIIAPMIGIFLVSRKYSLMADTLSHVSLAGVAIGLLLNIYPLYTAIIIVVIAAILIQKINSNYRISSESTLALFLSGGLALATVLISLAHGFTIDLFSYLFGSITTVSQTDLWIISILGIVVATLVIFLYKELTYVSYDEETAKVSGVSTTFINYLFIVLTAVTIAISIRIIGILLISALMIIPILTASQIANSYKNTIFYAIILNIFTVITGLILSFYLDLAAGGTIVLIAITLFISTIALKKVK